MTDIPPLQTPAEKAEAAATRRRWITFGEVLAVVAVLISAATLWNSYRERSDAEADRHVAERRDAAKQATLLLKGTAQREGQWLTLVPLDGGQAIQDEKFYFPDALLIDPVEVTGDGRIEAVWFETKLKRARAAAGRGDETKSDERLPVAIATRFLADGAAHDDLAIYDVGYAVEDGGFLKGKVVRMRGLSLVERTSPKRMQGRLNALWQARTGRK